MLPIFPFLVLTTDAWVAISTAIGTVFLAGATFWLAASTRRAAAEAAGATQLSAAIDLTREYRSPEMHRARLTVRGLAPHTPGQTLADLHEHEREAAFLVSRYLDNLGTLVSQKLLSPEAAGTFLGVSAVQMWSILKPYIEAEREASGQRIHQLAFQYLAELRSEAEIEKEVLKQFEAR